MKAVLVYQNGIANVFKVSCFNMQPYGRDARRLLQADFRACENFARGMAAAGVSVATAACNQPGDIVDVPWVTAREEAPFQADFRPVWHKVRPNSPFASCDWSEA